MSEPAGALDRFAAEVGPASAGPVVAVGGRTAWAAGGAVDPGAREVRSPAGVVDHQPAEMTVRVRAGTPVDELGAALAEQGQCVALPGGGAATVGGVLAVGCSGVRRLGLGPVRDTVLEVRYVSADGRLVRGGGPTVKNVSGFDLPRLLVGSLGTLGLIGEVVLRTRPVPACERWFRSDEVDPFAVVARAYRPVAVLWDGSTTWVALAGHPDDVDAEAVALGLAAAEVDPAAPGARPELPPHRWSLRPSELRRLPGDSGGDGRFVAEVGVGIVHRDVPQPPRPIDPALRDLHRRLKAGFDPTARLAPGRDALQGAAA